MLTTRTETNRSPQLKYLDRRQGRQQLIVRPDSPKQILEKCVLVIVHRWNDGSQVTVDPLIEAQRLVHRLTPKIDNAAQALLAHTEIKHLRFHVVELSHGLGQVLLDHPPLVGLQLHVML